MKKKRLIIALAAVLAVAGCVLPWWDSMYIPLLYEEAPYPLTDEQGFFPNRLKGYRKKLSALPGPVLVVPSQECARCLGGEHGECQRAWKVAFVGILDEPTWMVLREEWWDVPGLTLGVPDTGRVSSCTCPHCHPR